MFALPEVRLVLEQARVERRRRLDWLPVCPVLPEVGRVPELVRAIRLVCERVRPVGDAQRGGVVVRVREDHHVLRRALAQQEVVRDLSNADVRA